MELEYSTILISSFLSLIILLPLCFKFLFRPKQNLPPTPPSLPIVGHLHLIKLPLHHFYHSLSQKYGPIFSLRFGSRRIVVVSSSTAAEECFTKNDIVLANRPKLLAGKYIGYNYTTIAGSSYGEHWRNLRRICAIEIFSSTRLNAFVSIRRDEVRRLLMKLGSNEDKFVKVKLTSMFNELAFNNIMRMVAGKRYHGNEVGATEEGEAKEFRELIKEFFSIAGTSSPGDFLPILNWIGSGRSFIKRMMHMSKRMDRFFQKLIDEARACNGQGNTMSHHLLSLQQTDPSYYTDQLIKGLILVMLLAGTDTATVTLEWAMSNLLNNPNVLKKARAELDSQIGQENLIDESDISKLPYLQSIILETLRLKPAAPLLLPHVASSDCTICGYDVPRGTMVMINAWAIHRDPKIWEDPTSFKPERFENGEGESYNLMPFGLGRRACPGAGLARRMVDLTLASLIQCFEWERVSEKEVDMAEGSGLTMPKLVPLEAMCKSRPIVHKTFTRTI